MSVFVKIHPPLEFGSRLSGTDPGTRMPLVHAFVTLAVPLDSWSHQAAGVVQVVRRLDGPAGQWRATSIPTKQLRPAPSSMAPAMPDAMQADLESWIAGWRLTFYRQPELAMISDVGEQRRAFEDRVSRRIKPLIQKKIREIESRQMPRLPWKRKQAEQQRHSDLQRVTGEGVMLKENIESRTVGGLLDAAQRLELGLLLLVPGTKLPG